MLLEFRPYIKPTLLIIVGILFLTGSLLFISKSGVFETDGVEIIEADAASTSATLSPNSTLIVEVSGAVKNPGVYTLKTGSRVQDALLSAGNILSTADNIYVEKNINRAAKVVDGQKIYIPSLGETVQKNTTVSSVKGISDSLININSASQTELESLPGIGPVTAGKIIGGRLYGSIDELTAKKVITGSVFEKIKDLISL